MRAFNLAVWRLGIKVRQLNVWNPETYRLEVRRYNDDGTWEVVG